jgi:hypothetical protein
MANEFCGNVYHIKGIGDVECERPKGHVGWHTANDSFKWKRKEDQSRERMIRQAKAEAIEFVRALAEDPRSVPWAVTARELVRKMDGDRQ